MVRSFACIGIGIGYRAPSIGGKEFPEIELNHLDGHKGYDVLVKRFEPLTRKW